MGKFKFLIISSDTSYKLTSAALALPLCPAESNSVQFFVLSPVRGDQRGARGIGAARAGGTRPRGDPR
jgi:hypothetical protein